LWKEEKEGGTCKREGEERLTGLTYVLGGEIHSGFKPRILQCDEPTQSRKGWKKRKTAATDHPHLCSFNVVIRKIAVEQVGEDGRRRGGKRNSGKGKEGEAATEGETSTKNTGGLRRSEKHR